eukprot:357491-Chlamydomonas_euryale.AAC.1
MFFSPGAAVQRGDGDPTLYPRATVSPPTPTRVRNGALESNTLLNVFAVLVCLADMPPLRRVAQYGCTGQYVGAVRWDSTVAKNKPLHSAT